jgi:uncharacterized membrane protein YjgN (DUF898 family)
MKKQSMTFTGNGWEVTGMNFLLAILTGFTFGIALPYQIMWNVKYYIEHTEINK